MKFNKYLQINEAKDKKIIDFFNDYLMMSDFAASDVKNITLKSKSKGSLDNFIILFKDSIFNKKVPVTAREIVKNTKVSMVAFVQYLKSKGANISAVPDTFK